MHILATGISHQSTPVDLRERLAFRSEDLPEAFERLRLDCRAREAMILSTCNRVEIYACVPDLARAPAELQSYLVSRGGGDTRRLESSVYRYADAVSVRHLFAVASGLDSMVLGENEILGQVKTAYEQAKVHGATGKVLNVLFQKALNAAKAVRTQTGIGVGRMSVGTVAVDLAEKIFGDMANQTVLLVGAGEIGEQTLKHLLGRGVSRARILNRSLERAERLAQSYHATACALSDLERQLQSADIVIASTSANKPVVTAAALDRVMRLRHQQPLCLIDLGVPRNIETAAGALENVYLFNIDDLQRLVAKSVQARQEAVCASQAIIDRKVAHFLSWWGNQSAAACGLPSEPAAAP